jgi:hypothetical protein
MKGSIQMARAGDYKDLRQTIKLLGALEKIGFTNAAFRKLHHHQEANRSTTIGAHRRYCEGLTHDFIEGSRNALVQQRLEIAWKTYRCGGFKSNPSRVFVALAEAAYFEIQ